MFLEAIANYLVVASVFGVFVSADISGKFIYSSSIQLSNLTEINISTTTAQRAPEDTVAFELFTW